MPARTTSLSVAFICLTLVTPALAAEGGAAKSPAGPGAVQPRAEVPAAEPSVQKWVPVEVDVWETLVAEPDLYLDEAAAAFASGEHDEAAKALREASDAIQRLGLARSIVAARLKDLAIDVAAGKATKEQLEDLAGEASKVVHEPLEVVPVTTGSSEIWVDVGTRSLDDAHAAYVAGKYAEAASALRRGAAHLRLLGQVADEEIRGELNHAAVELSELAVEVGAKGKTTVEELDQALAKARAAIEKHIGSAKKP